MHPSRRALLAASGAALLTSPLPAFAGPPDIEAWTKEIDAAALAAIEAGACPGVAVGMSRHGEPLLTKGYGLADLDAKTPVAADSVFRIGSLTKQFTAALIVKLAAEGRLGLDDPAARYLPVFANAKPFTLRQLLHHTAGLHSDESDASPTRGGASPKTQIELAQAVAGQPMLFDFEPGTAWLYSNANYIVLGAVVEAVTGKPLARAAEAMIFKPLGLGRTAFDTSAAIVPGRVTGYTPVEGKPGAYTPAAFIEISDAGGAGAMRSTVGDLGRWHHTLFTNRLFDARHVEMMLTPGRLNDGRLSGANRYSPDDASYGDTQYGMGLLILPPANGFRSVIHYGFINGFSACLESWPESGVTTAILCNGDVGPALPFRAIRKAVKDGLISRQA
ncbi:MAG: serine hydrolase domain-containing protein [Caulobacteraceae bacterium]